MLIFEQSRPGRHTGTQIAPGAGDTPDIPACFLRETPPALPEVSELQAVRHYTRLSQKNFSIDTHFYPLGSCTMKYNPRVCHRLASLAGFLDRHPAAPPSHSQGVLACLHDLQEILKSVSELLLFPRNRKTTLLSLLLIRYALIRFELPLLRKL